MYILFRGCKSFASLTKKYELFQDLLHLLKIKKNDDMSLTIINL